MLFSKVVDFQNRFLASPSHSTVIEIGYFKANIILSNVMDPNHLKCAYTILNHRRC